MSIVIPVSTADESPDPHSPALLQGRWDRAQVSPTCTCEAEEKSDVKYKQQGVSQSFTL